MTFIFILMYITNDPIAKNTTKYSRMYSPSTARYLWPNIKRKILAFGHKEKKENKSWQGKDDVCQRCHPLTLLNLFNRNAIVGILSTFHRGICYWPLHTAQSKNWKGSKKFFSLFVHLSYLLENIRNKEFLY